jgi:hypothetical protein
MSEKSTEKRRFGVPKYYYWGKSPPKPAPYQSKSLSNEQRKFRFVIGAFTIAKLLAIVAFLFLIFGRL